MLCRVSTLDWMLLLTKEGSMAMCYAVQSTHMDWMPLPTKEGSLAMLNAQLPLKNQVQKSHRNAKTPVWSSMTACVHAQHRRYSSIRMEMPCSFKVSTMAGQNICKDQATTFRFSYHEHLNHAFQERLGFILSLPSFGPRHYSQPHISEAHKNFIFLKPTSLATPCLGSSQERKRQRQNEAMDCRE
jgi:hypothetical protein